MGESVYARDPHVIDNTDQFAWSKRTGGFVPWSIFHTEETANAARKKEVLFFGDGWGDLKKIKEAVIEPFRAEITPGDLYDLRHRIGTFASVPRVKLTDAEEVEVMKSFGYKVAAPHRVSIRVPAPFWPPIPINFEYTVKEMAWFDAHPEEAEIRDELLRRQEETNRSILASCFLCAKERNSLSFRGADRCYVHTGIVVATTGKHPTCMANDLHHRRTTIANKVGDPYVQSG